MHLPPTIIEFDSVEQLDQLPRDLGWPLEYRQLKPGSFSSSWSIFEDDSFFLLEEQSTRDIEVSAGGVDDVIVMAVVEGDPGTMNGQMLDSDHVFFQSPGSSLEVMMPAGTKATQIGIPVAQFEKLMRTVAPEFEIPMGVGQVLGTAPGRLDAVRQALRNAILAPSARAETRDEIVSACAADIIAAMADYGESQTDQGLRRAAAYRTLERARNYIEAHAASTIRIESMCEYVGTTLRTLERIFVSHLGVTPQQYVKARRLNAVRRQLVNAGLEAGLGVTEIAMNHGFNHLGRFSGEYRKYFGETPRQTLRAA